MKQQAWDKMSDNEKGEYLNGERAIVKTQVAMDGNSRVGDNSPAFLIYFVERGGVTTGKARSLIEAATQDDETIKQLIGETK